MVPGYPFGSIVLNLNVVTNAHRDAKDLQACLVLVLGDHAGGELCLVEPGIVLPLKSGDLVLSLHARLRTSICTTKVSVPL